jgi:hypothetical protein
MLLFLFSILKLKKSMGELPAIHLGLVLHRQALADTIIA